MLSSACDGILPYLAMQEARISAMQSAAEETPFPSGPGGALRLLVSVEEGGQTSADLVLQDVGDLQELASGGGGLSTSSLARFERLARQLAKLACRQCPPMHWDELKLGAVGRHDLAYLRQAGRVGGVGSQGRAVAVGFAIATGLVESELGPATLGTNDEHLNEIVRQQGFLSAGSSGDSRDVDGLQSLPDIMSLRFPEDRRAQIVASALQSSRAQPIVLSDSDLQLIQQDPSTDIAQLRQTRLLLMARRTCAAAAGRGSLTVGTLIPSTSTGICVPPIVMHGVTRSGKKVVIDFSAVASI